MKLKEVDIYLKSSIDTNQFEELIKKLNFIKESEDFLLSYRNINMLIKKHKYKKNESDVYILKFYSEDSFVNFNIYDRLSKKFFERLNNEELSIIESNSTFETNISVEEVIFKLLKRRFKKPYEELDTLVFKDNKTQNELIFASIDNMYKKSKTFQLFINNSDSLNVKNLNTYIKRIEDIFK